MMAVCSSVAWSELTEDHRLDAEYYQPVYLKMERELLRLPHGVLGDMVADIRYGLYLPPDYTEDGLIFVRGLNLREYGIDGELLRVPLSAEDVSKPYRLSSGDILISRSGNVGDVGIVDEELQGALYGSYTLRIKTRGYDAVVLYLFLKSSYGRLQLDRLQTGAVQGNINVPNLRRLIVPALPSTLVHELRNRYGKHRKEQRRSKNAYAEAEMLLESALALDKLDLTPRLFYERSFADARAAGRLDGEYFQPPKWAVLQALSRMKGQPITDQYRSVRELWQPDRAPPDELVRNYDLTEALQPFLDESVSPAPAASIGSTKKRLRPGDLVVSRLRSYLKEIAVVLRANGYPMVGSTEFIALRPRKGAIRAEALLVYLRSRYVQTVLKWCQDGSNHPRFDEKELLNLRVPQVVADVQDRLAAKLCEAIDARREARRLLDEAKAMVEREILGEQAPTI